MNSRILYIYIFLIIFFADAYFVLPWLKPITILNYLLVVIYLFSKSKLVQKEIREIQILLVLFIASIFVIDLVQNDIQKAFSSLLSFLPIPFILAIFSNKINNYKFIYFYAKWYIIYNGIFALFQLAGIYVTAGELLANVPILDVDSGFFKDFQNQGLRISGASYSTIGYACSLGVIFLLFYYTRLNFIMTAKARRIYLVVIAIFIIMTQTRSVLFSIIPVIYLTNVYVSKKPIKTLLRLTIGVAIFIGLLISFQAQIKQQFPRLFLRVEEDGSVVHRVQANIFGVVGTFYRSPITGVPIKESLKAMDLGYQKVGLVIGSYYIDEVTQHNQPAYFFRYYGFIGLAFFILVYGQMFKIALNMKNPLFKKKILFSIILFHIMYTFFHNNKFNTDYYLWLFMALHFNEIYFFNSNSLNEQKEKT